MTAKITLNLEICCPMCGTPEGQNSVRYPDAMKPGNSWIQCAKCGTLYKPKWEGAGSGGSGTHE